MPSFYVLDVMRAITGRIPNHEELQHEPRPRAARGSLGRRRAAARRDRRGRARSGDAAELVDVPDARAVADTRTTCSASTTRCGGRCDDDGREARSRWRPQDGLMRVTAGDQPISTAQRLGARPYSVSALQKFATCPYQFVLSAIYRLEPNDDRSRCSGSIR